MPTLNTRFYRKKLPHWEIDGAVYFVTIRLKGRIPEHATQSIFEKIRGLEQHPNSRRTRLKRYILRKIDEWLDRAPDPDYLIRPQIAEILQEAIRWRVQTGIWKVIEYVIMPNHLHLLIQLTERVEHAAARGKRPLEAVMDSFNKWTSHQAGRILKLPNERFWQGEWFDRWCRDRYEEYDVIQYIRNNPVKAGLVKHYRDWPYGSWNDEFFKKQHK